MKVSTSGPEGALGGLAGMDFELHGVRAKLVRSGRVVDNQMGSGETLLMICYVDGRRSTRRAAIARLSQHITIGQKVEIEGPMAASPY